MSLARRFFPSPHLRRKPRAVSSTHVHFNHPTPLTLHRKPRHPPSLLLSPRKPRSPRRGPQPGPDLHLRVAHLPRHLPLARAPSRTQRPRPPGLPPIHAPQTPRQTPQPHRSPPRRHNPPPLPPHRHPRTPLAPPNRRAGTSCIASASVVVCTLRNQCHRAAVVMLIGPASQSRSNEHDHDVLPCQTLPHPIPGHRRGSRTWPRRKPLEQG